jgi:nifR3 family TIM-barrel protein
MDSVKLLSYLQENPFVVAPMAAITDNAFRSFMKDQGAGIVVTELISATAIKYGSERTLQMLEFEPGQHPLGIQIFGEDPQIMAYAARVAQDKGADFVDINFGCPVPKVTKKGGGSAALKDLPLLTRIIAEVKSAISIPLTIKIRTGWDQGSRNADQVCSIAYNEGVTWVAIHGRTRSQSYDGLADWEYIRQVKSQSKIAVLGNGDVVTAGQAVEKLRSSGCDGILIGRGVLKNPQIIRQAKSLLRNSSAEILPMEQVIENLYLRLSKHCAPRIFNIQLKKLSIWFSTGYPNASQFRKQVFQLEDTQAVFDTTISYFKSCKSQEQHNPDNQGFLMGGHG